MDLKGNTIKCQGDIDVDVKFRGNNNTLIIHDGAIIKRLDIVFDCDNGYFELGSSSIKNKGINASVRIGQDSKILIGEDFTCVNRCMLSALEGSTIEIGNDCMIASGNEIKTDDAHPIFDVLTEERINFPRDIYIGNHVWLGRRAVVLGGADIRDGSVIGYGAICKGYVSNNCIAVGVPARVIKKNIAWERPHLSINKPFYKRAQDIKKSMYWNVTEED